VTWEEAMGRSLRAVDDHGQSGLPLLERVAMAILAARGEDPMALLVLLGQRREAWRTNPQNPENMVFP
jgi:hypothetical protein